MICKKCGEEIDDLSLWCPTCFTFVDLDEHEKKVDEGIATGLIKKKHAKIKKNHVLCEKCGASIRIPDSSFCGNCSHIINRKAFIRDIKEIVGIIKDENEEDITYTKNHKLSILCCVIPFVGLILKKTYKETNPLLSKICFKMWSYGLIIRPFLIMGIWVAIMQIF